MSVKYRYMLDDDGSIIFRIPLSSNSTLLDAERYDFKSKSWSNKNISLGTLMMSDFIDESVALRLINS
ncbi:MAG: hypothetical protein ACOX56_06065 [Acholeplasmataceae bacterium]